MYNFNSGLFESEGKYDIPIIKAETLTAIPKMIGFNYAKTIQSRDNKGVHFFLDDYQFERVWNTPTKYIGILSNFKCVFSPDFSMFTDYPKAMQIFSHFKKHLLGALWQANGIKVIPTICWSDESSFEWCFDGEPKNSVVAVSSVGTQADKTSRLAFMRGYEEMLNRLNPTSILFYGTVPSECDGNIIELQAFQSKFSVNIDS